jgi:hypothetical protein
MTPEAFIAWLDAMKNANLAKSDAECGRMMGISPDTVVRIKREGADLRTALACRALFHRLEPWS